MCFHMIPAQHLCATRTGEISDIGIVRALAIDDFFDHLGNNKIQIGIALPVTVAAHINRHAIDTGCEISAVIEVETAQKELVGLAAAAMLGCHKPGYRLENLTSTQQGSLTKFIVRNTALRRGDCSADQVYLSAHDFNAVNYISSALLRLSNYWDGGDTDGRENGY